MNVYCVIPDHPIIRSCELTGYPGFRTPCWPVCPVCGSECSSVYLDDLNRVLGCDNCVTESCSDDGDDTVLCPYCKPVPERIYSKNGEIVGCDNCVTEQDAWEWAASQEDDP